MRGDGRAMSGHDVKRAGRKFVVIGTVMSLAIALACSEVGSGPNASAAIELAPLSASAIVVGDSLRDVDGVALPVHAIVRNLKGDVITDAAVRYVYADASRDSALFVDSITGYVVALKALGLTTPTARIAARVGNSLQVVRNLQVTTRPDSADRNGATKVDTLSVSPPDTGANATTNVSASMGVSVRHLEAGVATAVNGWLVKYELIQPANSTNDSTKSAFLVDENGRRSNIDTTDASGTVARYVRVRASVFPATTAVDSAVVLVSVKYKGQNVKGAPIRIVVPVKQRTKS